MFSLSTIVHTSPQAIYSVDRHGKVTFWTPAAERMFGWTAQETLGQPLPFIPNEGQRDFAEFLRGAFAGAPVGTLELAHLRKDGSLIHIKAASAPLFDPCGVMIGVMAIAEDITHRKLAEKGLRANEEQFRLITEHVSDLIALERVLGTVESNRTDATVL